MSRRAMKSLFAVAVTATAVAATGLAFADESRPSVQVEPCMGGKWDADATGVNQRGEDIAETFSGEGCTILAKNGTTYWWAIGHDVTLTMRRDGFEDHHERIPLHELRYSNGQTVRYSVSPPGWPGAR